MNMAKRPFLVVFKFLTFYFALYALFYLARGGSIERIVIDDATVAPAARVIAQLMSDESVRALGNRIVSARGGLAVQSGCEGVETLFLLLAGIIAFPARLPTNLR